MKAGRVVAGVAACLVLAVAGAMAYQLSRSSPTSMILCIDGQEPIPALVCRSYFYSFRGTPDDIAEFDQNIGLGAIFDLRDQAEQERMLRFLLDRGADINFKRGKEGMTPLHSAVFRRSAEQVSMLREFGARTDITDDHYRYTPLQLAEFLQGRHPGEDWQPIIAALTAP